jgi:hypothetical protein
MYQQSTLTSADDQEPTLIHEAPPASTDIAAPGGFGLDPCFSSLTLLRSLFQIAPTMITITPKQLRQPADIQEKIQTPPEELNEMPGADAFSKIFRGLL